MLKEEVDSPILVVDDDQFVRDLILTLLKETGYPCKGASSAREAREVLAKGRFSLVLLDIRMPGESGMSLLEHIVSEYPDVAVLMVTAQSDMATAYEAIQKGAYGYIIKPFGIHQILIDVYNALRRRTLEKENREYQKRLEEKVREQVMEIKRVKEQVILKLLAASELRDVETGAHIYRIGLCTEVMARKLGYSIEEAEKLRLAAFMHDVGKIGIPDSILRKRGKLTSEEWEIMKTHTVIGGRVLAGTNIDLLETARVIALYHHEKWDGSGYPEGLSGETIPEPARIVAIIDVYDSLIHKRVYKPAWSEKGAKDFIKDQRGKDFDPRLVDVFFQVISEIDEIHRRYPDQKSLNFLNDCSLTGD